LNRKFSLLVIIAAALVIGQDAAGQLNSDLVPRERIVPRAEQIRRDMELSRFRVGPFRLHPQFLLRDVGYTDNVFGASDSSEAVEDFGGSVALGTRWILPFGPKGYLRGTVLPEYTWSAEVPARRFLGGTYDASAIALFNRLSIEGTVGRNESLAFVSSETEAQAIRDLTWYEADVELELSGYISVFANARGQEHAHDAEGAAGAPIENVSDLDREDRAVRAGIRYRMTSFFDIAVAAEQTESAFDFEPLERDNKSEAILVSANYARPRSYINATIGQRQGDPDNGSNFRPYDETVGSYFGAFALGGPLELQAFGHRTVRYGLDNTSPYFFENRNGLGTVIRAGSRLRFRASAEAGENDYPVPVQGPDALIDRSDDVLSYGAGFDLRMYRNVTLTIFVSQSEFDSNLDPLDRSVLRVQTGIALTGDFPR
jgi:hypothetical protein